MQRKVGDENRNEYTGCNLKLDFALKQIMLFSDSSAIPKIPKVQNFQKINSFKFVIGTLLQHEEPFKYFNQMLDETASESEHIRIVEIMDKFVSSRKVMTSKAS